MPHYHIDAEEAAEYVELAGKALPDGFESNYYEPAEARADFGELDATCRRVRDALVAAGFEAVTVTYDGGGDEGFARFESAERSKGAGDTRPESVGVDRLAEQLGDELVRGIPFPTPTFDKRLPPEAHERLRIKHEQTPNSKRAWPMLADFAGFLADRLLGSGFGTGEYSMRGRFRCDLNSGEMVDVEADPPESGYFPA